MEWNFIALIILAIPVILLPVAVLWFLNPGGIYAAIKKARNKKAAGNARRAGRRTDTNTHDPGTRPPA